MVIITLVDMDISEHSSYNHGFYPRPVFIEAGYKLRPPMQSDTTTLPPSCSWLSGLLRGRVTMLCTSLLSSRVAIFLSREAATMYHAVIGITQSVFMLWSATCACQTQPLIPGRSALVHFTLLWAVARISTMFLAALVVRAFDLTYCVSQVLLALIVTVSLYVTSKLLKPSSRKVVGMTRQTNSDTKCRAAIIVWICLA